MSIVVLSIMAALFFIETGALVRSRILTNVFIDDSSEALLRLNFNITLLDLHCDYVSVDVWDALGTNRQNVTRYINKWQLDEAGVRRVFSGRNRESEELNYTNIELNPVEGEGEAVTTLTKDTFQDFLQTNEMAFIVIYAPWYDSEINFTCLVVTTSVFSSSHADFFVGLL